MDLSDQQVPGLIDQLEALRTSIPQDEALRHQLSAALQKLSLAIETPLDTVRRIAFSGLQLTVTKVGNDLRLFDLLSEDNASGTVDDLVLATKAERPLLVRILRYLAAVGMIAESPEGTYSATIITRTLSQPGFKAGLQHHFEAQLPSWLALPSFLASTSYVEPSDPTKTSFQVAHGTTLPAFQWATTQPHIVRDFALWMSAQRAGQRSWLETFSPDRFPLSSSNLETPLFVDVGGGVGHQCLALKSRFPDLKRRIVLQDLPDVLARAAPVEGVERMAHDLWTEQPVIGASYYYLRNVLHDHPDEACVKILRNIKAAMSQNSAILIDEMVLPHVGTAWQAAQLDIAMMASLAGRERGEADWRAVVVEAGLCIRSMELYEETMGDTVIVVELPNIC